MIEACSQELDEGTSDEEDAVNQYTPVLASYMRDVERYPILSREEEHAIAKEYQRTRAPRVGQRLVTANLRLVVKLANRHGNAAQLVDLVQEGNLGLLEALNRFDPDRGIRFPSYATFWINAYMWRYTIDNARIIRIGTTERQVKIFYNLGKARRDVSKDGEEPTPEKLAAYLNVPLRDLESMLVRLASDGEESIDVPLEKHTDSTRDYQTLADIIPSTRELPDVEVEESELRRYFYAKLDEFERTLDERERAIFCERWLTAPPTMLKTIGERYGICVERVRQLETSIFRRLKTFFAPAITKFA